MDTANNGTETNLPDVLDLLFISQKAASPDEPLTVRTWSAGADVGDLVLDIADGGRRGNLYLKGMGIGREFDSEGGERHKARRKTKQRSLPGAVGIAEEDVCRCNGTARQ